MESSRRTPNQLSVSSSSQPSASDPTDPDAPLPVPASVPLPLTTRLAIPLTVGRPAVLLNVLTLCLLGVLLAAAPARAAQGPRFPNVLLISVDALRADRLSGYGYERPTSPRIDELMARGARFEEARTVEPLTSPALCSLLTSRFPHEHGSTRNGLRLRPGLDSLPKLLAQRGYRTAAFVGNWTLRNKLSGLGEHFDEYHEVFSRKRWFGLFNSEATGQDLTDEALSWIGDYEGGDAEGHPWFVWVHYVEPHAPYRLWEDLAGGLGIDLSHSVSKSDRYDTEIAFTDREVGRLLDRLAETHSPSQTLVIFVADHGESLGEHRYWGHGRHLYENGLRIPMAITWPGRIPHELIETPALNLDLAPTVLSLLGLPAPAGFRGVDWSPVFHGQDPPAVDRVTHFEAHKGAVRTGHASSDARRAGLLEVGRIDGTMKEVFDLRNHHVRFYDLAEDPEEVHPRESPEKSLSDDLRTWLETVEAGLDAASDLPVPELDAESRKQLEALGYID